MNNNEQYPARVEAFNDNQVTLYEIDGREYLNAEDIGVCLGMAQPRKSVNNIYNRNREELDPNSIVTKMMTNYPGNPVNRLFDETGCNLISMFARTPQAKDFRLWLAKLPRKIRQVQECLPEALEEAERRGAKRGAARALALMENRAAERLGTHGMNRLLWYRLVGLTQDEAAMLTHMSRDRVQDLEKPFKEMGIVFKAASAARRKREVREALAGMLAGMESPALPAPEPDA